jgi:hypothetical protein
VSACFAGNARNNYPHLTVIVVNRMGWRTFADSHLPALQWLRLNGAVSLLSPGLPRPPDPVANNYASFTAGDVINTRNPAQGLLQRQLLANDDSNQALIENVPSEAQASRLVGQWKHGRTPDSVLMFLAITPEPLSAATWDELTPMVILGPGYGAGVTLTSATTRTRGLIALRDVAPTILDAVGAPVPESMTGAPAQQIHLENRDAKLERMDNVSRLGELAIVPLSWFLGLSALLAIGGGVWLVLVAPVRNGAFVTYLLRVVLCAPLSMLIAPCIPLNQLVSYVAALIAIDLTLALIQSTALILTVTAMTILVDGLTGTSLIASSVISGYWLSGIRFYGIGNEYMGVLIAMALLAPALLRMNILKKMPNGLYAALTGVFYVTTIFILSYPAFGAKAGGAVTSVAALGPAWYSIVTGRRPNWLTLLLAVICGFVVVFAFAELATVLHAPPSHIQSAVAAVHSGKLGYIKHIALRKAKMAIKTVFTPGGFVGVAALVLLMIIWRKTPLSDRVKTFLAARNSFASTLAAGGWALLAALLFNDSGSVAVVFMFGAMSLVLLNEMVNASCASSR